MQTAVRPYPIASQATLPSTPMQRKSHSPFLFLLVMLCGTLFFDAVLPLRGLWFYDAFLKSPFHSLLLLPTHLFFPGSSTTSSQPALHTLLPESLAVSWQQTFFLIGTFLAIFLCYLLAVRTLPPYISRRFILLSTLSLGAIYTLIPTVNSQDVFSYIAYARIGALYHLNPLTTLPTAIHTDSIYPFIFWVRQPSAYGPTWAIITSGLQWIIYNAGLKDVSFMVLALRLFGLAMHLGSTYLVWSISGRLQATTGYISPLMQQRRLQATLAFGWNPLLLFEACVNAHNDTTILFLLLLALWALTSRNRRAFLPYIVSASLFALAACLKITFILLFPGLLLYLWTQRSRPIARTFVALIAYSVTLFLLYAPFWDNGIVLHVLQINPGTMNTANTPYDFFIRLNASFYGKSIPSAIGGKATQAEHLIHQISMVAYIVSYALLTLWYFFTARRASTLSALVRWLALAWLLYCLVGSPWFWPWYITTFFGLYALVEVTFKRHTWASRACTTATRFLSLSMFSVYCFSAIVIARSNIPYLHRFSWSNLSSLGIWFLPFFVLLLYAAAHLFQRRKERLPLPV